MPTLLCTAKYRKTFAVSGQLAPDAVNEGALGPWYANTLNLGSQRLLHFMSSPSLLSVVILLRDRHTAERRFISMLQELLDELGCTSAYVGHESAVLQTMQYGRASDRSKLASLLDQARLARRLAADGYPLHDINVRLAETPCGPMAYASPRNVAPQRLEARWRWGGA